MVVSVTDTGEGMAPEVLDRVFEPFFTTKEVGKGTGLGLSMVYGFTQQSGGRVEIKSAPGQGTAVRLYLPRLTGARGSAIVQALSRAEARGSGYTVLVVEDDDAVRRYTVDLLSELGYKVLDAQDGATALRVLEREGDGVDLLFTDVVMPGLSGPEVAHRARALRPELKVLFTSGYVREGAAPGGRMEAGFELLPKPFTHDVLGAKLEDMLGIKAGVNGQCAAE